MYRKNALATQAIPKPIKRFKKIICFVIGHDYDTSFAFNSSQEFKIGKTEEFSILDMEKARNYPGLP